MNKGWGTRIIATTFTFLSKEKKAEIREKSERMDLDCSVFYGVEKNEVGLVPESRQRVDCQR